MLKSRSPPLPIESNLLKLAVEFTRVTVSIPVVETLSVSREHRLVLTIHPPRGRPSLRYTFSGRSFTRSVLK